MYKNLALLNGSLLAVMIFLNGLLTGRTGPYLSTLIFHVLGLVLILMISLAMKNRITRFKALPLVFYLPGIFSVITILLNNITVPQIGLTLATGVTLFGQLVVSGLVEHFGLFGMPTNRFKKEKIIGYSIISLGIAVMITV